MHDHLYVHAAASNNGSLVEADKPTKNPAQEWSESAAAVLNGLMGLLEERDGVSQAVVALVADLVAIEPTFTALHELLSRLSKVTYG